MRIQTDMTRLRGEGMRVYRECSGNLRRWVLFCLLTALVVAGSGGSDVYAVESTATPGADATTDPEALQRPCPNGRIRVRDLVEVDRVWAISIEADSGIALNWRGDAVLVSADVTCEFLAQAIRVRTIFYSPDARALYEPETGRERPLDPGEPDLPALPVDEVRFEVLERALLDEGIPAEQTVTASGITIRYNFEGRRFGPDAIPLDTVVFHVTIGGTLDARDYYVDAATGEVYHFGA